MIGIDCISPLRMICLLAAATVISASLAWLGFDRLAEERQRLAVTEAMALVGTRPRTPIMTSNMAFGEPGRRLAAGRFETRLSKAALGHRLLVERLQMIPAQPDYQKLLMAEFVVSGGETEIKRFTHEIERGTPAIRFESWRITHTATGEPTVRIDARALALWEAGT